MKIYKVQNGNYILGYFQREENAIKANEENNKLIDGLKGTKHIDLKPCWIDEIETND